jgi:hypothetical protein
MAVVLVHQGPDVTRESYDQVVRSMMGKDRAESPSDWPVEGLLAHAAGEGPKRIGGGQTRSMADRWACLRGSRCSERSAAATVS